MACKLLFVAPSAYVLSGLATWLDYLEPGLTDRGWDVIIGLVEGARHHKPERYLAEHAHRQWVKIPCFTATAEGRRRAVIGALDHIRPDLVNSVNIPDAMAAVGTLRGAASWAPRITVTIHGTIPYLFENIAIYRRVLDGAVCANRLAVRLANELGGLPLERIAYAPSGVVVPPTAAVVPREGRLVIAWAGRMDHREKRALDLPLILAQLNRRGVPFECLVAGAGPDEESLRERLAEFIGSGSVRWLGCVPHQEMAKRVFRNAHAFLMTSATEGSPHVVWEAMANGSALVTAAFLGLGHDGVLEHGSNALIYAPGDIEAASTQLELLWRDGELLSRIARCGREAVAKHYCVERSVEAWDRGFRQLMDLPARRSKWQPPQESNGRLDRLLGPRLAESCRIALGRRRELPCPGAEWPHTHGTRDWEDDAFWSMAVAEDQAATNARHLISVREQTESRLES